MRHPPRSSLLVAGAADLCHGHRMRVGRCTASGVAPACPVECSELTLIPHDDGTPTPSYGIGLRERPRSLDG
ncbi:hypothetical protein QF035_002461 [Streptomyces umbrinus]|uniref:Ferredoxin n=1 Tax=Streptomyces umbrinus TaxID=67370 RepID=A0ABU0SQT2_9ACTN|nr:hypothetical protein [Streptomyces umbrinus]